MRHNSDVRSSARCPDQRPGPLWEQGAGGSNPLTPTILQALPRAWAYSDSLARAHAHSETSLLTAVHESPAPWLDHRSHNTHAFWAWAVAAEVSRERGRSRLTWRSRINAAYAVVVRPTLMRLKASQLRISQLSGSLILWTRA